MVVVPGLVIKAALANLANQQGNISISYQSNILQKTAVFHSNKKKGVC